MMYSHDGFGLGHVQRNLGIARRLLELSPGSNVLVLAGTMPPDTDLPAGIDLIKLPSILKNGTGNWLPRTLSIHKDELKSVRSGIIRHVATAFRPDVFLVDFVPTGVWGELKPTLKYLCSDHKSSKIILGLREFLDAPEITRRQWAKEGAFAAINSYYSRIFVYGNREIFDTAKQYGLEHFTNHTPVEYCGYVCLPPMPEKMGNIYREIGLDTNRQLVLVTGGGGRDAFPMMKNCLEAFRFLYNQSAIQGVFVAGPLMSQKEVQTLRNAATGLPVRILDYVRDLKPLMDCAGLIVSMAGYNTLVEAVGSGKRVLAIPRSGPSMEQKLRADAFSRLGLLEMLTPDLASPGCLAKRINHMLKNTKMPPSSLVQDGLDRVAERLLQLGRNDYRVDNKMSPLNACLG